MWQLPLISLLAFSSPAAGSPSHLDAPAQTTRLAQNEGGERAHIFSIQIDYRFDYDGYFDDPLIRANLEEAVNIWSAYITDDFPTVKAGTPILVLNPYTLEEEQVVLDYDVDDLVLFAAGSPNLKGNMAKAGPITRWYSRLDQQMPLNAKKRLHGNDFQPWAGFLSINPNPDIPLRVDPTPQTDDDMPRNTLKGYDFLTLALHEMGHVLGIGTSKSFKTRSGMLASEGMKTKTGSDGRILFIYNSYSVFYGKNARLVNNGHPIMLSDDKGHTRTNFLDHGQQDLMDQDLNVKRQFPTHQDLAILVDIGYKIPDFDAFLALPR